MARDIAAPRLAPGRERGARGPLLAVTIAWLAAIGGFFAARARRRRAARNAPPEPFEWPEGLSDLEASARKRPGTVNELSLKPVRTWQAARHESIFTVFNLNLVGLAIIQLILGEWFGALITLFMLGLTTGIRLMQQGIADRRMERFRAATPERYAVIRSGQLRTLRANDIVQGDILVAGPGDQIIADGPLLGPASIVVDASAVHHARGWRRVRPGRTLYAGSFVASGRAVYRADFVGRDRAVSSRVQRTAALASRPTQLEGLIARILQALLIVVAVYVGLLLASFLHLDLGEYGDALVQAAPVIFSLIPTGMYLMIVVTYAAGMVELAQYGGLVHSARSIETLAETTVLCFTEVGTLAGTSVALTVCADEAGERISRARVRQALGDFARSTTTHTEIGRLLADAYEGEQRIVREEGTHLSTLGWTAITYGEPDAEGTYVIGRRAVVEPRLMLPLPTEERTPSRQVLVLAHRAEATPLRDAAGSPVLPDHLVPLGLVTFGEDVDVDAMDVVQTFRRAGVQVKAFAVGSADLILGLLRAGGMTEDDLAAIRGRGVLSRADLEAIQRADWGRAAAEHVLFGGLTPVQMAELVRAMRADGEVVTVVGDGMSDLPALTAASLAVAQPASTQAALGMADIVLRENQPRALLEVLRHGQGIVGGLLDVIKLNLTMVICTALLIVYVRTLTVGFPYLASQGSIISVLTATIPSVVLGLVPPPPPGDFKKNHAQTLARFCLPAGVLLSLAGLAVYEFEVTTTGHVPTAQLAVAYLLLYAGLLLNLIIRPRRRFAALVGALALIGTLLPLLPQARRQFRIDWMEPRHYLVVALAIAVWFVTTTLVWRWLERRDAPQGRSASTMPSDTRSPARHTSTTTVSPTDARARTLPSAKDVAG